jgi:hypothetical protein
MTLGRKDAEKAIASLGGKDSISKLISTPAGRVKLAAAMMQPLRCGGKDYPSCPDCGMLEENFTDGEHPWQECTVYRVMES